MVGGMSRGLSPGELLEVGGVCNYLLTYCCWWGRSGEELANQQSVT